MVTTFQEIIETLQKFWVSKGCLSLQPLDLEVGAGTFHPASFLRAIGPEPWSAAYVQASRRPTDGRYGDNPNRLQHYYQFQVILKPSPLDIQAWYLESLQALGVDPLKDDIRFVEDNWASPSLGAWGLGWEVWQNGMEISQFTYFQQVGGLTCKPITGELTYGLERLALYLLNIDNVYDIPWGYIGKQKVTYGEIFHRNEVEMSTYNFEQAPIEYLFHTFQHNESEIQRLLAMDLALPAYEIFLKSSHIFNLLDARHAISVTERQQYMLRLRQCANRIAESYYAYRERLGFPLKA